MKKGKKRVGKKKAFLLMIYVLYISFLLIFTIPYFSGEKKELMGDDFGSTITFTEDGSYGHYTWVKLSDNMEADGEDVVGTISFEYIFDTNTLYVQKIENIQELAIDCELMYQNKCEEIFGIDSANQDSGYYKEYFKKTNDGLFTVIINSQDTIDTLQFFNIPRPKSVLVDGEEWWQSGTGYYSVHGTDVTVTNVPEGLSTVHIYFKNPKTIDLRASFTASKYTACINEEISFDPSQSAGDIESYLWDFGDGVLRSTIETEIAHTYTKAGIYEVRLTVRDGNYSEDSITITIEIEELEVEVLTVS